MSVVRTVLGDIDPQTLGITLGHEHVFARPPADIGDSDLRLDDSDASVHELEQFHAAGGGAVVEMTTIDYGRDASTLVEIARRVPVHLVAATGFNKGAFADRLTESRGVAEIASWMIGEVQEGIEQSAARAGVIKTSSSLHAAGVAELKVFEAAAIAHRETGAPISTHTEKGTWALEQAQLLIDLDVPPSRILIGHLDLRPDLSYLHAVAMTGVYVGLDQFAKSKYLPDEQRVRLIMGLIAAGHLGQLILSGDMARRSYWHAYGGGPGFSHIPTSVRMMLLAAGLSGPEIKTLLVENPHRFLAFDPK